MVLYSITRPLNVPVAKGFVQTLDAHALVGGVPLGAQYSEVVIGADRKSTRLNSSHSGESRMPSSA